MYYFTNKIEQTFSMFFTQIYLYVTRFTQISTWTFISSHYDIIFFLQFFVTMISLFFRFLVTMISIFSFSNLKYDHSKHFLFVIKFIVHYDNTFSILFFEEYAIVLVKYWSSHVHNNMTTPAPTKIQSLYTNK